MEERAGFAQYQVERRRKPPERRRTPAMAGLRRLKAFADGFGGAVIGGVVYWVLVDNLVRGVPDFPWLKVLALAAACGSFELWRVSRQAAEHR
jgi:hypothetical protein